MPSTAWQHERNTPFDNIKIRVNLFQDLTGRGGKDDRGSGGVEPCRAGYRGDSPLSCRFAALLLVFFRAGVAAEEQG